MTKGVKSLDEIKARPDLDEMKARRKRLAALAALKKAKQAFDKPKAVPFPQRKRAAPKVKRYAIIDLLSLKGMAIKEAFAKELDIARIKQLQLQITREPNPLVKIILIDGSVRIFRFKTPKRVLPRSSKVSIKKAAVNEDKVMNEQERKEYKSDLSFKIAYFHWLMNGNLGKAAASPVEATVPIIDLFKGLDEKGREETLVKLREEYYAL